MRKIVEKKGITLIALVITIIVLLILAGITINLTIGQDGIFRKAEQAGENYVVSEKYEQEQLAKTANEIDEYVGSTRDNVIIPKEEYEGLKKSAKIGKPNTWEVGTEYDFGDGVYGKRFTGTITIAAKTLSSIDLFVDNSIETIISYGGKYEHSTIPGAFMCIPNCYNTGSYTSSIQFWDGRVILDTLAATARSNSLYDVWILYTKVTN